MITAPEGMTKELWLKRCSERLRAKIPDMEIDESKGIAEACFENLDNDLSEHPEDAADEEMSYWDNDA